MTNASTNLMDVSTARHPLKDWYEQTWVHIQQCAGYNISGEKYFPQSSKKVAQERTLLNASRCDKKKEKIK